MINSYDFCHDHAALCKLDAVVLFEDEFSADCNSSILCSSGGRNGYGAKLCNIFSLKFTVETACKEYKRSFKQVQMFYWRVIFGIQEICCGCDKTAAILKSYTLI